MTARELLTTIDQMRPNAFTDREKLQFLNTIEGRIYTEILNRADGNDLTFIPITEGEEERELIVPIPYTDLYIYYMGAMIDFYNGDSGRYNDTVVLYNDAWENFAAYYRENNKPKQTNLHGMIPHGWGW